MLKSEEFLGFELGTQLSGRSSARRRLRESIVVILLKDSVNWRGRGLQPLGLRRIKKKTVFAREKPVRGRPERRSARLDECSARPAYGEKFVIWIVFRDVWMGNRYARMKNRPI